MTNERPNLKQIRIKKSVCARLDERKSKDDSYSDVVQELLDENDRLKASNVELKQDKENLVAIAIMSRKEALEVKRDSLVKDLDEYEKQLKEIDEQITIEKQKAQYEPETDDEAIERAVRQYKEQCEKKRKQQTEV